MRRILLTTALLIVTIILFIRFSKGADLYSVPDIPFGYDPNNIQYKLLGGIEGRAGTEFIYDVNCYDPDGDDFVIGIVNPQTGMTITENTLTGKWDIAWIPAGPGLYYIDVEATDIPPPGNTPLSARGTILFNILPGNRPPVLVPR